MESIESYLSEILAITSALDRQQIKRIIDLLSGLQTTGGRVFFLGVGGGAANASHAVNDARKIACLEAYCPTDNAAELSARINDSGWDACFTDWLKASHLCAADLVFVFSVGGGSAEKGISRNIVRALAYAKEQKAKIAGITGRDGGFTAQTADACLIVPPLYPDHVTPHTESFQLMVWHLILSHPRIMKNNYKWESSSSNVNA